MKELVGGWLRLETDYLTACGTPLWLHAIPGDHGVILLDSGISSTPEAALRAELRAAGLRIEDVGLVINSHAHPDHRGGNAALRAVSSARFAAPAAEVDWLEDNDLLLDQLWGANPTAYTLTPTDRSSVLGMLGDPVRIDWLLRDGDPIPVPGGDLRVVTTSGHSPGHIAVHDPTRGLVFTFDDVQGRGTPLPDGQPTLAPLYHDVDRYVAGLRRLRALDFELLVPSHGDVLDRAAGLARIAESLAWVAEAEAFVHDYLCTGNDVALRELAAAIGTSLGNFGGVNLQTVSIARAHLDHLTARGAADLIWRDSGRTPAPFPEF